MSLSRPRQGNGSRHDPSPPNLDSTRRRQQQGAAAEEEGDEDVGRSASSGHLRVRFLLPLPVFSLLVSADEPYLQVRPRSSSRRRRWWCSISAPSAPKRHSVHSARLSVKPRLHLLLPLYLLLNTDTTHIPLSSLSKSLRNRLFPPHTASQNPSRNGYLRSLSPSQALP